MSETKMNETEPDQNENNKDQNEALDTNEEVNPATEKAPNPDGDPDDDRMGAPAVMPD